SPGGRFLNLAETMCKVSGSTNTFQPVLDAMVSRTWSSSLALISAVMRLAFVCQSSVSAACARMGRSAARHSKKESKIEDEDEDEDEKHCKTLTGDRFEWCPLMFDLLGSELSTFNVLS